MKRIAVLAMLTALTFIGLNTGSANAWTYGLTGSGNCQPDGSFKIVWKVNNLTENQPLRITYSSNTSVVAAGTQVPARSVSEFMQTVSGSVLASYNLTLKGNWQGDQAQRTRSATVTLNEKCVQPVTPPAPTPPSAGGQGAGVVLGAQVRAPVGAVNAGEGGASTSSLGTVVGLVSSLAVTGYGIYRFSRN